MRPLLLVMAMLFVPSENALAQVAAVVEGVTGAGSRIAVKLA